MMLKMKMYEKNKSYSLVDTGGTFTAYSNPQENKVEKLRPTSPAYGRDPQRMHPTLCRPLVPTLWEEKNCA